ncbi:hypothetical protein CR513_41675, partial [Mucuna pruriens]
MLVATPVFMFSSLKGMWTPNLYFSPTPSCHRLRHMVASLGTFFLDSQAHTNEMHEIIDLCVIFAPLGVALHCICISSYTKQPVKIDKETKTKFQKHLYRIRSKTKRMEVVVDDLEERHEALRNAVNQ